MRSFKSTIMLLVICKNVNGLIAAIGISNVPAEWRLFIDSSTRSLKAVLLHNGNRYPSLHFAYSVQKKENYDNLKELLEQIHYEDFQWEIWGDFKMLGLLLGLQGGYTKHSCFLCLWDSRSDKEHYNKV